MSEQRSRRFGLDATGKAALLASLRQPVRALAAAPAAGPAPVDPGLTDFRTLPLYQQIRTQRGAVEVLGIGNPFLREHQVRAGATTEIAGRAAVNFASYDYLGLNGHPEVAAAAKAAIDDYGTSVSASRVVAGERPVHRALETALAGIYEAEDAVVFVSGHATNVSTIGTLMSPDDLILHDALSHNSIVVGADLSRATRRAFPHGDYDALEALLAEGRGRAKRALIVAEGLYSMDGDVADLARLVEIKRRWGAWLMIDEAHALGVLGAAGRGSAEHAGVAFGDVDIWMGTLSKTLAGCGGYVAGNAELIDILKHHAAGFVFSVGLSAPLAAAARTALSVMQREPQRVARLAENGRRFLEKARSAGLDTGLGQGHAIAPVMIGDSLKAVALSERMLTAGVNVLPIIFPAVPMQSARLRFFISSEHTEAQIDSAIATLSRELAALDGTGFSLEALLARLSQQQAR